jgi:hypothetical protein
VVTGAAVAGGAVLVVVVLVVVLVVEDVVLVELVELVVAAAPAERPASDPSSLQPVAATVRASANAPPIAPRTERCLVGRLRNERFITTLGGRLDSTGSGLLAVPWTLGTGTAAGFVDRT